MELLRAVKALQFREGRRVAGVQQAPVAPGQGEGR